MCKACRNTYPKATKDTMREHELNCKRAFSTTPGAHGAWWELEPGYLAEEIVADRDKPSSKPKVERGGRYGMDPKSWTDTWRETWIWAQKVNNTLFYDSREAFLRDLADLMRLQWEIPHPGAPTA